MTPWGWWVAESLGLESGAGSYAPRGTPYLGFGAVSTLQAGGDPRYHPCWVPQGSGGSWAKGNRDAQGE